MQYKDLVILSQEYANAMSEEGSAELSALDANSALESEKQRVLLWAHEEGNIDGKNAEMRELQGISILENSASVDFLHTYSQEAQMKYLDAKIERQRIETLIGLTKAWLYSQGGHL